MSTVQAPSPGDGTFAVNSAVPWPPGAIDGELMPRVPDTAEACDTSRRAPSATSAAASTPARPNLTVLSPFMSFLTPFLYYVSLRPLRIASVFSLPQSYEQCSELCGMRPASTWRIKAESTGFTAPL